MLENCCFCFNLKYGFLAFGTVCLAARVGLCTMTFFVPAAVTFRLAIRAYLDERRIVGNEEGIFLLIGLSLGWFLSTSFALYLALKGIIQNRSILLYPYIVILIIEGIIATICTLILAILKTPLYLLIMVVFGSMNTYTAMCLIGLYTQFKEKEKRTVSLQACALKTI